MIESALPDPFKWLFIATAVPIGVVGLALLAGWFFGASVWCYGVFRCSGPGVGAAASLLALGAGVILNLIYLPQAIFCLVRLPHLRTSAIALRSTLLAFVYLCCTAVAAITFI